MYHFSINRSKRIGDLDAILELDDLGEILKSSETNVSSNGIGTMSVFLTLY